MTRSNEQEAHSVSFYCQPNSS